MMFPQRKCRYSRFSTNLFTTIATICTNIFNDTSPRVLQCFGKCVMEKKGIVSDHLSNNYSDAIIILDSFLHRSMTKACPTRRTL